MNATQVSRPGALVYLTGASGSGKDSVLAWIAARLTARDRVRIARRYITRDSGATEASIALSDAEFARRAEDGRFAMHWRGHGLSYGVGIEIDAWIASGDAVIVNGSRAYLPHASARYAQLIAVELVVSTDILAARLLRRGREDATRIAARIERAQQAFAVPDGCTMIRIPNDTTLDAAASALFALARAGHAPDTAARNAARTAGSTLLPVRV
ncbi:MULTISPECIES: phosphonate metabolism protein/1,5-bisphosphokinase (PRPP-forming) PhnN [Burkholderia]|uniref:phosphonate metabolism protein/1,5-bisphosphokinase (PRPP-forming) PhnN n=1 Tax=Burkholderia TaxID=32008 RepID=UPI000756A33E|nr:MULTISPECIES: phosphonate metabolism protein/1,5-bisphosphokinase (PRPP-forming) PhnN [Burkholderia]AOJ72746.1 ribose-phosphate pyrophosphokinase [Burkholderia savannae]KVG45024.1 ribose-phosphate pyrophosphokinase [Burkholderia sp. MSMB0265]KVG90014.1 ribose-phosphate pyrophosphokinase [Burkholderia sp. MSMB2040]KVG96151.1 ribose-phosphate pyrophosphokinase [Burkholderia sp. MSMB2041]KVG99780.1 ribose-phosphate pyrophosphokinase [Burkholderia sp. MSMB2042]